MRHVMISFAFFSATVAFADGEVMYLANEGLLVTEGETKVLFDPLFRNNYGQYQLLPLDMEDALMAGEAPFDGVDAVFISHFHGDHFSPGDVANYLKRRETVQLFAPKQATDALTTFLSDDEGVMLRVTTLDIGYEDPAIVLSLPGIAVEAFNIPHSGWPDRMPEVQNIAFRITLNNAITVLHLGDADTRDEHFARDGDQWAAKRTNVAFPPYWFFTSERGNKVLEERIQPGAAVGIHVPKKLDPRYSDGLDQHDLFRTPGETRIIPVSQ
jgi:L-ascorbate metabolism protein UlaG (beta-lactamase superfamily)